MAEDGVVKLAVIGNPNTTGDGQALPSGTIVTPVGQPDIRYKFVTPFVAVAIRAINNYLTIVSGLLAAAGVSATAQHMLGTDFLSVLRASASLAIAGTAVGLIKDLVTVFGSLEKKYPLLTGNV